MWWFLSELILKSNLVGQTLKEHRMSVQTISPIQLSELIKNGQKVHLIDVRTPLEFREVHATFANNIPLDKLVPSDVAKTRNGSNEPLYLICKSGGRGKQACDKLIAAGQSNVIKQDYQSFAVRKRCHSNGRSASLLVHWSSLASCLAFWFIRILLDCLLL
jgi:rhodanese-related sulfurtransferase